MLVRQLEELVPRHVVALVKHHLEAKVLAHGLAHVVHALVCC